MLSKLMQIAVAVCVALVLTACASTPAHLATPIKTIDRPVLPPVAGELLVVHERPAPPADGSPEALLNHAVEYGGWVAQIEAQLKGWQDWYRNVLTVQQGQ